MGSRPHLKAAVLGALKADGSVEPFGSGFPVDGGRRLLISCAHVWNEIMQMYDTNTSTVLDPMHDGVAVGFAKEDGTIEWCGRAVLRGRSDTIDLVVLQMTAELDGSALPAAHTLPALRLGDTAALQPGDKLTILGFGHPAAGMSLIAMPVFGEFSVIDLEAPDGPWIRLGGAPPEHPGHSGGPVLNSRSGKVVGWVVRTQRRGGVAVCSEYRPVESLEPLLAKVLIDLEPGLDALLYTPASPGPPKLCSKALRKQLIMQGEARASQRHWLAREEQLDDAVRT